MLLFHLCGFISLHLCDKKQGDESHHHTRCCRVAGCPARVGNLEESSTLKVILAGGSSLSFPELEPFMLPFALFPASNRERHAASETRGLLCPSANLQPDFVTSFAINDLR